MFRFIIIKKYGRRNTVPGVHHTFYCPFINNKRVFPIITCTIKENKKRTRNILCPVKYLYTFHKVPCLVGLYSCDQLFSFVVFFFSNNQMKMYKYIRKISPRFIGFVNRKVKAIKYEISCISSFSLCCNSVHLYFLSCSLFLLDGRCHRCSLHIFMGMFS